VLFVQRTQQGTVNLASGSRLGLLPLPNDLRKQCCQKELMILWNVAISADLVDCFAEVIGGDRRVVFWHIDFAQRINQKFYGRNIDGNHAINRDERVIAIVIVPGS
jgi:hypothetical protein